MVVRWPNLLRIRRPTGATASHSPADEGRHQTILNICGHFDRFGQMFDFIRNGREGDHANHARQILIVPPAAPPGQSTCLVANPCF